MHRCNLVRKVIPNSGSGVIASAEDTEWCSALLVPDHGRPPAAENSTHQAGFRTGEVPQAAKSKAMPDFEIAGPRVCPGVERIDDVATGFD